MQSHAGLQPVTEWNRLPLGFIAPVMRPNCGLFFWSNTLSSTTVLESSVESTVSFAELGVPSNIVSALANQGITQAFPIQTATLPDALAGRDVCGKAPTGSGKTIAFGIPLLHGIASGPKAAPKRPKGLVLVPTRELATQVREELIMMAGPKGARVTTFFGGVGFGNQLRDLRRGVDIAVACPGRLADLVKQGEVDLSEVRYVVLDEADRMADMGFLPEVRRLLNQTSPKRQTLLFSATLDGDVDILIREYQHNPARHEHVVKEDSPQNEYKFWNVERNERVDITARLISANWPAIVFVRTRRGADRAARQLANAGVSTEVIHGDRSQPQRERALARFTNGQSQALVATDVAARGIHVDNVAAVIHFDLPADHKDFVHRSGRTGRAGTTGLVVALVPKEQNSDAKKLQRKLQLALGITPPASLAPVTPTKAPASKAATSESTGTNPASKRPGRAKTRKSKARRSDASTPGSHNPSNRGGKARGAKVSARTGSGGTSRNSSPGASRSGNKHRSAKRRNAA